MADIKIENIGGIEPEDRNVTVEEGDELLWALWEAGVPIRHNCGGNAECTTCRVVVHQGETHEKNEAERNRLKQSGMRNVRLSCQLEVRSDMRIDVVNLLSYDEMEEWKEEGR